MNNASIVYDIIIAAVIPICVFIGIKKGFLRTVLSAAVCLAAVLGAAFISNAYSEDIYMKYLRPKVISAAETEIRSARNILEQRLSEELEGTLPEGGTDEVIAKFGEYLDDPELGEKLKGIAEQVFGTFSEGFSSAVPGVTADNIKNTDIGGSVMSLIGDDKIAEAAEAIEEKAVRSFGVRLIGYILWSLAFAVINVIGRAVTYIVLSVRKIHTVAAADRALGGALGLVTALLIIIPIAVLVKLIAGFTDGAGIFAGDVINSTVLFKYIYNLI